MRSIVHRRFKLEILYKPSVTIFNLSQSIRFSPSSSSLTAAPIPRNLLNYHQPSYLCSAIHRKRLFYLLPASPTIVKLTCTGDSPRYYTIHEYSCERKAVLLSSCRTGTLLPSDLSRTRLSSDPDWLLLETRTMLAPSCRTEMMLMPSDLDRFHLSLSNSVLYLYSSLRYY